MKNYCILLLMTMCLNVQISNAQTKKQFLTTIEGGLSIPAGEYLYDWYTLAGANFKLSSYYMLSDKMGLGLVGMYNFNSFDATYYAGKVIKDHSNSSFGDEPLSTKASGDGWGHLGLMIGYNVVFPVGKKCAFDVKVSIGVDLYSTSHMNSTTYYDDPFDANLREEMFFIGATGSSFLSSAGIGFRYKFNDKISLGLNVDLASTKIETKSNYTYEELDDDYSYVYDSGIYDIELNAIWINTNLGLTFALGKGESK